jgi:GTPase SAR1 family protein
MACSAEHPSRNVKLNLFDMSGEQQYHEVRTEFYPHTQVALLVFDVTNAASFKSLETWLLELSQNVGVSMSD